MQRRGTGGWGTWTADDIEEGRLKVNETSRPWGWRGPSPDRRRAERSAIDCDEWEDFRAFLFEDLPATDRRVNELYLDEVDKCDVYLGIFGTEYGAPEKTGLSPMEREFVRATEGEKCRLILVSSADDAARHPKMTSLIQKAEAQLVHRRFADISDLLAKVHASLVQYLDEIGKLSDVPFDAAACAGSSLKDISAEKVATFLRQAVHERRYPLPETTPVAKALAHLNLMAGKMPTHGAVLLFGHAPQRFMPSSEMKCLHFHGTEIAKPIPSYQIFKGTVFELVDSAVNFVITRQMRHIRRRRGQIECHQDLPLRGVGGHWGSPSYDT
jgi:hypothetical protein